jgi:integrase
VKFRTAEGYEELLRTHITPTFGTRRIGSITSREIEAWLGGLADRGLAMKTVHNAYTPLVATFKYAQRHNIIRHNPCSGVELPATPDLAEFEGHPLTRVEVLKFAAELDHWKPYGLAGRFFAGSGLRAAEFAGLRLSDYDVDRGVVSVTRTLTRRRSTDEWIVGTPKSKRGRREVPPIRGSRSIRTSSTNGTSNQPQSGSASRSFDFTTFVIRRRRSGTRTASRSR